ncbi:MAG: hypothetical protein IJJ42_09700 [Clostridia bacterium]|nr:hypothetical protein [Clostridia bacterium]
MKTIKSIAGIVDNSNQLIDGIPSFFDRNIGSALLWKRGIRKIAHRIAAGGYQYADGTFSKVNVLTDLEGMKTGKETGNGEIL